MSPVVDCYDGMPVAWAIGTSPNAALANGMLDDYMVRYRDKRIKTESRARASWTGGASSVTA